MFPRALSRMLIACPFYARYIATQFALAGTPKIYVTCLPQVPDCNMCTQGKLLELTLWHHQSIASITAIDTKGKQLPYQLLSQCQTSFQSSRMSPMMGSHLDYAGRERKGLSRRMLRASFDIYWRSLLLSFQLPSPPSRIKCRFAFSAIEKG